MGLRFIPGGVAGATGRAGGLLLLLLGLFLGAPSEALEPVELQLKWTHSFQFAGYVMALEKGYYRDAGLEVRLREAGPGTDPVDWVLGGRGATAWAPAAWCSVGAPGPRWWFWGCCSSTPPWCCWPGIWGPRRTSTPLGDVGSSWTPRGGNSWPT